LQKYTRFLLPLFIATAMSFPIHSYDRRIYKYDHFPTTRYIRQIMPFHTTQNRANYIAEGNIHNTNVLRTEQQESKDSKYFNKVYLIKFTM